ncbi:hypothetical protein [Roseibium sp.]|uniref:hypothetical protein n=1 Tax=Roseibium sp. TaxID=1936156 RepID=UPI00326531FC
MGCRLVVICLLSLVPGLIAGAFGLVPAGAAGKSFRLSAPQTLVASGFMKHLLPRFSLKTQVRIELVGEDAAADARFVAGGTGRAVFSGLDQIWTFEILDADNAHLARFEDWITGKVGRNTISAYRPGGKALFSAAAARQQAPEAVVLSGDAIEGEKLSVLHCGRCHMVNEATRMSTIGSSPSFAVMRAFSDWQYRFEAFFALNPHPSFTMIDGVTEPFDITRPPPMVPLELTLEELEAILAYVSRIPPADLGAPIQYQ